MIFKKKKKTKQKRTPDFIIEYYPYSEMYTVRKKGKWLKKESTTGIVRLESLFDVVTQCKSLESAKKLIKLYKEQKLNKGMKEYAVFCNKK